MPDIGYGRALLACPDLKQSQVAFGKSPNLSLEYLIAEREEKGEGEKEVKEEEEEEEKKEKVLWGFSGIFYL